jgi:hypothetical protein
MRIISICDSTRCDRSATETGRPGSRNRIGTQSASRKLLAIAAEFQQNVNDNDSHYGDSGKFAGIAKLRMKVQQ